VRSIRLVVLLALLVVVAAVGISELVNYQSAVNAQKARAAAELAYTRAEARFAESPIPSWLTPLPSHSFENTDSCPGTGICGNSQKQPWQLVPQLRAALHETGRFSPLTGPACIARPKKPTRSVCPVNLLGRLDGYYAEAIAFRWMHVVSNPKLPAGTVLLGHRDGRTYYFKGSLVLISLISPADATGLAQFVRTGKFPPYNPRSGD